MPEAFDYRTAFSRNIGWVTDAEQAVLRRKRVAIAGLGGVGGFHLLTLVRLGVGAFTLAEFDTFDLTNFNRQAGAGLSTVGRRKLDVLVGMARDINPELEIRTVPEGVTAANVDEFLDGADLYVDGLDFFALEARRTTFAACARLQVPATTAAPIGMGVALLNFLPAGMTFEQYFRLEGQPEPEQAVRLLAGVSPLMLHRGYLVDRSRVDFTARRGPSTAMACQLCAGVAATEALKILLRRGKLLAAPWGMQFDAYRNKMVTTWRPLGNRNPIQRLVLAVARRQYRGAAAGSSSSHGVTADRVANHPRSLDAPNPVVPVARAQLESIVEAGILAPSADNHHVVRFKLRDTGVQLWAAEEFARAPFHRRVLGLIALGAVAENMSVRARALGLEPRIDWFPQPSEKQLLGVLEIVANTTEQEDLDAALTRRHTNRRFFRGPPMTAREKEGLETEVAATPGARLLWLDDRDTRRRALQLIRIAERERFRDRHLHEELFSGIRFDVGWHSAAPEGLAPGSLEVEAPLRRAFATLRSWPVMRVLNRVGAHWLLGIRAGDLPCRLAPHVALLATTLDLEPGALAVGRAFERVWLRATITGHALQPLAASALFALDGYTEVRSEVRQALALGWRAIAPGVVPLIVFRLGCAREASVRSGRRGLEAYLVNEGAR